MTAEEVKYYKTANVLLKSDFMTFARFFFKKQYGRKYAQWEHLYKIGEVMERVLNGELKKVIINIAPRYGKTELAVKMFIGMGLALNPAAKFIHVSYSDSLALDNSEAARDLVASDEFQAIFPNVKLKPSSKGKKKWATEAGGGVYATSAGGQITGFGAGTVDEEQDDLENELNEILTATNISWLGNKAKFGGAIIIDDPNKPDDADSETLRMRVNDRYDGTVSNRVNSRNTPIVITQQRTHPNDLSGYLIDKQGRIEDGGEWFVLSLPSIKEDGTALCPAKHTIEELRALEKHNDVVFQRQHMQNPKPKSGLAFPIDDLMFADMSTIQGLSDPDYSFIAADPAGSGGDDFAAGYAPLVGDKIYIVDVLYNTDGTDHNEAALAKMIVDRNPASVGVEAIMGWAETANRVRDDVEKRGYSNEFRQLRPRTNKHVRIINRAAFIRNNFVFRHDWADYPQYAKFMRCLTSYLKIQEPGRENKKDDAPDLCEMIAAHYERSFPHLWAIK